jgi:peroxiredoxin
MKTAIAVLILLISAEVGTAQVVTPVVDMGWLTTIHTTDGWRVTEAPPAPTGKPRRTLRVGDLLSEIDGHDAAKLGPLAIAAILDDVPFRAVPTVILRDGQALKVSVFGEGVITNGEVKPQPTYRQDRLQPVGAHAPQFSLPDLSGHIYTLDQFRGRWLILTVWGTWCSGCLHEIPALQDLAVTYADKLTVLSVAVNDPPETLTKFVSEHSIKYPVLLGASFDAPFARVYEVHGAPANIVVSREGTIVFVGRGPMSLKGAVQQISSGMKSEMHQN